MAHRTLTAGADELAGRVGGAVLAAIRSGMGTTQEQLAERLQIGLSTVQAWEAGRRPLVNASYQDLQRLNRRLRQDGATPALMNVLDQALLVDTIYTDMAVDDGEQHPLALVVPDRTVTELLAWPLTGTPPRDLNGTKARLHVPAGVRDAVALSLTTAADRNHALDERGAMMRRQVKFLVGGVPGCQGWVDTQIAAEVRATPDLRTWSPHWAVARSQAVATAHAGDLEPLRRFIERGLADDAGIEANLNYWAYWVGEHSVPWTQDSDMARAATDWSGDRLLDSLVEGVVHAPYRELCVHALWALLRRRSHLLKSADVPARVSQAAEQALATGELDVGARRRLEQVLYLTESVG